MTAAISGRAERGARAAAPDAPDAAITAITAITSITSITSIVPIARLASIARIALTASVLALAAACAAPAAAPDPAAGGRSGGRSGGEGQVSPQAGYQPQRGQYGKDVIWIPTPDRLVDRMLQLAQVGPGDRLVDLGSGDGKIVIAAAGHYGVQAQGIEYNGDLVAFARRQAERARVTDRASFQQGDIFTTDFSQATVVTMYLLPRLNLKLRETLFRMKPGTRIVSHAWSMGNWQPDETSWIRATPLYLWIIPANAGGNWNVSFRQGDSEVTMTLTLRQTYQQLAGAKVEIDGFTNSVRHLSLVGDRLRFSITDTTGQLRDFDGRIDAGRIIGDVSGPGNSWTRFTAQRLGEAPPIGGAHGFSETEGGRLDAELGEY